MDRKIEAEVAALERMTITQLVAKYVEVFGEHTRSCQRLHLIRRIAWRVQTRACMHTPRQSPLPRPVNVR